MRIDQVEFEESLSGDEDERLATHLRDVLRRMSVPRLLFREVEPPILTSSKLDPQMVSGWCNLRPSEMVERPLPEFDADFRDHREFSTYASLDIIRRQEERSFASFFGRPEWEIKADDVTIKDTSLRLLRGDGTEGEPIVTVDILNTDGTTSRHEIIAQILGADYAGCCSLDVLPQIRRDWLPPNALWLIPFNPAIGNCIQSHWIARRPERKISFCAGLLMIPFVNSRIIEYLDPTWKEDQ